MLIHDVFEVAVQLQPDGAVILTESDPPAARVRGSSESISLSSSSEKSS